MPMWVIKILLFISSVYAVMTRRYVDTDPYGTCLREIARLERELAADGVTFCMSDAEFDREVRQVTQGAASRSELQVVADRINARIAHGDADPGRQAAFNIWADYQRRKYGA